MDGPLIRRKAEKWGLTYEEVQKRFKQQEEVQKRFKQQEEVKDQSNG